MTIKKNKCLDASLMIYILLHTKGLLYYKHPYESGYQ